MTTLTEIAEVAATVIASVGGDGAIVFGLSGHLGRIWADRAVEKLRSENARDLERERQEYARLNVEFTHQLSLATERTKAAFRIQAAEHQVRFAKVYEKRAEVITEIDGRLHDLEIEGQNYVMGGGVDEAYAQWRKRYIECNHFVSYNRLYLTDQLYRAIGEYLEEVKKPNIYIWSLGSVRVQGGDIQGYMPNILAAVEDAHTKYPALRLAIVREFRATLEGPII